MLPVYPLMDTYFYPRSPCGERQFANYVALDSSLISIHALLAESDSGRCRILAAHKHFYPRSPCGERPRVARTPTMLVTISIHALLAESDPPHYVRGLHLGYFYPRSPCGERRLSRPVMCHSTYFYPRSPCGERPLPSTPPNRLRKISIHALLAESDRLAYRISPAICHFYPRSPCGERHA